MVVRINLKARRFSSDDQAWRLFPGVGYRHYPVMREHSVVFLEYPGFPASERSDYEQDFDTLVALVRSVQRLAVINSRPENIKEQLQDIENTEIKVANWSQARKLALGWINGLYRKANIGDLIVLPGPGWEKNEDGEWLQRKSLVGEIAGPTRRWERDGPRRYLDARYLVRTVKWLGEIDERDLEPATRSSMRTQNALVRLPAEELENVLGAAYRNVAVGDERLARFVTRNGEFTAHENFHFQAFVMATVAAHMRANDPNGLIKFDSSIYEIAASVPRKHEFVPEQDCSIHSPGYTTLKAFGNLPMITSALFALALATEAQPFGDNGQADVIVENSESASYDPCDPDVGVDEQVRQALNIIGFERWQEMCEAARMANEHEGFEPVSVVDDEE